jgi:hypothetical protein
MPLNYYLIDNPITPDPDDHMAVPLSRDTYTIDDLIAGMTSRGSTVTKAEAFAVIEEFNQAVLQALAEGSSVNTPLFNIAPHITGVFDSADDNFDPARHQVKLRINPGVRMRETEPTIKPQKVKAEKPRPLLLHFYDNNSESQDQVITSGGGARITGSMLKIDEADPAQGIYFKRSDNGLSIRATGKLLRNKPGELILQLPTLAPGAYRIEIKTVQKGSKEVRSGMLNTELTVV